MPQAAVADDAAGRIESWPEAQLRAFQLERLREVVGYARRNIPLYRELWARAGVDEHALRSLDDIARFPMVDKERLVKAGESWRDPRQGPVGFSTRGTSGEPLLLWLSAEEEEVYLEPTIRGFRWAGFRPGMTALLMSPVWHRLAANEVHAIARLGGRSAFFWGSMGADYVDSFVKTLEGVQPEFITTTAPFLLSVIRRASERSLPLAGMFRNVCAISVVGLPLTPRLREFLRDRTGAGDVFERGGTQEGAAIDECASHTAPHVHEDVCYLEVVDEAGEPVAPGVRGSLVVTKLTAAGSIFVRYNTGDIAAFTPGTCPCGCGFRRLKIYGRPESSVVVGGRRITAYDVRLCVEQDSSLVGRNVLLIRGEGERRGVLGVAIEGSSVNEGALKRRMRDWLDVAHVDVAWLGGLRINWGFRQVIDGREIGRTTAA